MKANKIDNQAKNMLNAYCLIQAGLEHLNCVWSDKHLINNDDMKEAIKQLRPKANYYIKNIESTFAEANVKQMYIDNQKEFIYGMIDSLWDKDKQVSKWE